MTPDQEKALALRVIHNHIRGPVTADDVTAAADALQQPVPDADTTDGIVEFVNGHLTRIAAMYARGGAVTP